MAAVRGIFKRQNAKMTVHGGHGGRGGCVISALDGGITNWPKLLYFSEKIKEAVSFQKRKEMLVSFLI